MTHPEAGSCHVSGLVIHTACKKCRQTCVKVLFHVCAEITERSRMASISGDALHNCAVCRCHAALRPAT